MDLTKYPRTKQLMDETGMSLDQLLKWTEKQIQRSGVEHGTQR